MMKIKTKLIYSWASIMLVGLLVGCGTNNDSSINNSNEIISSNDSNTIDDNDDSNNDISNDSNTINDNDSDSSEKTSSAQWYARTTVSAVSPDTEMVIEHKTAGIFGQLNESSDKKDRHDIIGMGTESATLEVVFPQNGWDSANGDYFSDYHSVKEGGDSWIFQVKNMNNKIDLRKETIKIALEGIYTIESIVANGKTRYSETLNRNDERLGELTLIDLDNRVEYTVSELSNAEISMDGLQIRTFKWVLGSVAEADYGPLTTSEAAKSMSYKSTAKTFKMNSETVPDSKFGLPPQ